MRKQNRVDFVNILSNRISIKSVLFNEKDDGENLYFSSEEDEIDYSFFNEGFAGRRYFYTVSINSPYKTYLDNSGCMSLYIFNWDGVLERIVLLDQMRLGTFVVDERGGKLYAVRFGKAIGDKNDLIVYDLQSLNLLSK